jgi:hypothetical protein
MIGKCQVYVWLCIFNLLAFNLTMVMMPEWYGISDGSLPARISFLSVGIWWIGFAGITFHYFPIMSFTRKRTISSKDLGA